MVYKPTNINAYTITDIDLDQGASFVANLYFVTPGTNNAINITGYSFSSQIRSYYDSANTANITIFVNDANNGVASLYLDANTSGNLNAGAYVYDLLSIDITNNVKRVLEGVLTINPQVTDNPWQPGFTNTQTWTPVSVSFVNGDVLFVNSGFLSANDGFNFNAQTLTLTIGNSTSNVTINSTSISGGNLATTTPGGSNTDIQFNDSGRFGGINTFVFNKLTSTVTIGNSSINTTINSTSFSGIANNALNLDGQNNSFYTNVSNLTGALDGGSF